jgi:RHS repeat-associated protein
LCDEARTWGGDDRLRQVKQGGMSRFSATYDGDGLRATKTDLFSATYTYSRGPGGVLYDGATTYTPGLSQRYNGINPRFVHSDWVGSTRYLSDSSGNFFPSALRYDAFGQRTALAGPNQPTPFQFAGGWGYEAEYSDSTEPYLGLSYLEQRYYEPATGRFISRDPLRRARTLVLLRGAAVRAAQGVSPFSDFRRRAMMTETPSRVHNLNVVPDCVHAGPESPMPRRTRVVRPRRVERPFRTPSRRADLKWYDITLNGPCGPQAP